MPNRIPLDMSKCEDDTVDEVYQLEIIDEGSPGEANPKFANLADSAFEDEIKKFQGHHNLANLKSKDKLDKHICELRREQEYRKRKQKQVALTAKREANPAVRSFSVNGDNTRPRSTRTANCRGESVSQNVSKTDCNGRWSKDHGMDGFMFSEEIEILNPSKGRGPFLQRPLNTEGSSLDGGKDKVRMYSGGLAGPSPRLGLRSSSVKYCNECKKRCPLTNVTQIGNGNDCGLLCSSCQKQNKYAFVFSAKESSKGTSPPGTASGRKDNVGGKRARQGLDGDSPEKVVELFSSEDEEEKKTRDTFADCEVSNQRKVYGACSTLASGMEGVKIAYPSRDDPEAVEVLHTDLNRLAPLEFLNDTVIDFYIKYIQRPEVSTVDCKSRFYFFNSFFYKKLSEVVSAQNKKHVADLSKLRKWTKRTNIFEKEYLFVPIHDKWHWSLAIVCYPGASSEDTGSQRCILHLDSMSPGHKSNPVFRLLRTYLVAEWEHQAEKDGVGNSYQKLNVDDFAAKKIQVPQQENESDCGLFLLHYIECFVREAPPSFKLSDVEQGKLFGKNWFKPSQASKLRHDILELLRNFFKAEAAKALESSAPIERLASDHSEVENILQDNVHDIEDERVMGVTESIHSPAQSSAAAPLHENNLPDSCLGKADSATGGLPPEALQVESTEKDLGNKFQRINPDMSSTSCADVRNSSGITGALRPGSSEDLDLPAELGARSKLRRVGSVTDIDQMNTLHQLNSLNNDMGDDDQSDLHLVVELPIQEEWCSADKSIQ